MADTKSERERKQNEGYDEAVRGGKDRPPDDVGLPPNPGDKIGGDEFDREAREAANDVRRQGESTG